jgi:hypothetical protein
LLCLLQCVVGHSQAKPLSAKLGAMSAVKTLAACPASSPERHAARLLRLVSDVLAGNTDYTLLQAAAEALGE